MPSKIFDLNKKKFKTIMLLIPMTLVHKSLYPINKGTNNPTKWWNGEYDKYIMFLNKLPKKAQSNLISKMYAIYIQIYADNLQKFRFRLPTEQILKLW